MHTNQSFLKGKRILAVDDETDILETIEDLLDEAIIDTATTYESASQKIKDNTYDLAILDIMGVNGLELLEQCVAVEIPAVMLTAHAISPEALMESIRKGAISYLPKEKLAELDELLGALLQAKDRGEPTWRLLFEKLGDYFDNRFGAQWQDNNQNFWSNFNKTYQISKGIQERLRHNKNIPGAKI